MTAHPPGRALCPECRQPIPTIPLNSPYVAPDGITATVLCGSCCAHQGFPDGIPVRPLPTTSTHLHSIPKQNGKTTAHHLAETQWPDQLADLAIENAYRGQRQADAP